MNPFISIFINFFTHTSNIKIRMYILTTKKSLEIQTVSKNFFLYHTNSIHAFHCINKNYNELKKEDSEQHICVKYFQENYAGFDVLKRAEQKPMKI